MATVAVVTPPSPRFADIDRQAAGGMGLWKWTGRDSIGHSEFAQYDLGLLGTAGMLLRRGHGVTFVDGQAERLDQDAFSLRVAGTSPDFIVGMVQLVSLQSDLSILARTKQGSPGARLIVVGTVAKIMTEEILQCASVDYVVMGEPEVPTADLIDALASGQEPRTTAGVAWRDPRPI